MKFLSFSNSGCKEICANMIRSLIDCSYLQEEITISCLDEETFAYLGEHYKKINLLKNFVIDDVDLKNYQNWSFDGSSKFRQIVKYKWNIIKDNFKNKQFVWIDTDVVVLKNLNKVLNDILSSGFDIVTQSDMPTCKYCTGFMIFNPTDNMIKAIDICSLDKSADDQIIFNRSWKSVGVNVATLDLQHFPNGYFVYKTENSFKDRDNWYIVHNNHMVGIENKTQKFKEHKMWYI
jgi:hypothetical protein